MYMRSFIYFYQYKITWHMFQYLFSGTKISMKTRALRFWKVLFNLNHPNWTLKNSKYYNPRSNFCNLLIIILYMILLFTTTIYFNIFLTDQLDYPSFEKWKCLTWMLKVVFRCFPFPVTPSTSIVLSSKIRWYLPQETLLLMLFSWGEKKERWKIRFIFIHPRVVLGFR